MTQEQIDALEKLIQYNWEDEENDWEECGRPENHIFTTIKVLNDYLADMKVVDVRSLTPRAADRWANAPLGKVIMVSIKQVQEIAQRIIEETTNLSNLVLLQAGYNKLLTKLYEAEAAQHSVQADCLPCGHPKESALQMEFGSWSCQMCKAANIR